MRHRSGEFEFGVIDSHVHLWDAAVAQVSPELGPAGSTESLLRTLDENAVERAVVVQPSVHAKDHAYVLGAVRDSGGRLSAIGLIEPEDRYSTMTQVEDLARSSEFAGLRLPLLRASDTWLEEVGNAIWERARHHGFVICLFLGPSEYGQIAHFVERFPTVEVVIDHVGRIDLWPSRRDAAVRKLIAFAAYPQVSVKVSALGAVARGPLSHAGSWVHVRAVASRFGPGRLMWGSDFPSSLTYGTYSDELRAASSALSSLSEEDHTAIFRTNALRTFWSRR